MASQLPSSEFWYVYLLRSEANPSEVYVGITGDLVARLDAHNSGKARHTSKHRPWRIETYVAFTSRVKAAAFERYLKTASGIAFARKRLR